MSYLIFINELGTSYNGENIYEFIFSDTKDVWGDYWDSVPCNQNPQPPDIKYITEVGTLKNSNIELNLIQNSDFFSMSDCMDGIISLGWEKESSNKNRLVFMFGEDIESINNKLYEKDIVLNFNK